MLQFSLFPILSTFLIFQECSGIFHSFNRGNCPNLDSMPDFEMQKFLGEWFIIEAYNDFPVHCLRENFTKTLPEVVAPSKKKNTEELENTSGNVGEEDIERKTLDMARLMNEIHSKKRSHPKMILDNSENVKVIKDVPEKVSETKEDVFKVMRSYFSIGEQKVVKEVGEFLFV